MKHHLFLCSLLAILAVGVQAQRLAFERYNTEDGLPGNRTRCFLKDKNGFLWIGTSQGLSRFDGVEFKHYTRKSGFQTLDDYVRCLFQDSEGLIWIGTNLGGLTVLDPLTDSTTIYKHDPENTNSIPGDRINIVTEDEEGLIWVGLANGLGLSVINKNTGSITNYDPFELVESLGPKGIHNILFDPWRKDTVWMPTNAGLFAFNKKEKEFHEINHPLSGINRQGLFDGDQVDENRLLVSFFHAGTDIYHIDKNEWQGAYAPLEKEIRVLDVVRKSETEYWLAARKKGLGLLNLESGDISFIPSDLNNSRSLLPGFTYSVYVDGDELWVGGVDGVSFYNGNQSIFPFDSLTFEKKAYGVITCAAGEADKIYLAGMYGQGLWEVDKKTAERTIIPVVSPDKTHFRGILELEEKVLLMSRWAIDVVDKRTKELSSISTKPIKPQAELQALQPLNSEYALILTRGDGAFKISLVTFEITPLFTPTETVIPIYNDSQVNTDGTIWIVTDIDIIIYDPSDDSVRHFRPSSFSSKQYQRIFTIEMDKNGALWIGASNGLLKIENEKEELLDITNSALASSYIRSSAIDSNGDLWLATDVGLSKLNINTLEILNFDKSDGVDVSGVLKAIDDKVFVGSYGGYSLFTPEAIDLETEPLKTYISAFNVWNEPFQTSKNIQFIEALDLAYDQNFFSFNYTAPSYYKADEIQFAYRMLGLSPDWVISKRRHANFTNLDGGSYVFEVKSRLPGQSWGDIASIEINLATAFWKTWWFRMLSIVLFLSIGFVIYKVRVETIQQRADIEAQELQLEAMQKRLLDLNLNPFDGSLPLESLSKALKDPLTERELEVLELSLEGKTNAEVADLLFVSKSTVKFHLRNVYKKLGVRNRKEALIFVNKSS